MDISVDRTPSTITIAPKGSLNTNTAPELEEAVTTAFGDVDGVETVVFDLADLDYISSAGLRVLMVAYKMAQGFGAAMSVANTNDDVQEVLEITGFAELFEN